MKMAVGETIVVALAAIYLIPKILGTVIKLGLAALIATTISKGSLNSTMKMKLDAQQQDKEVLTNVSGESESVKKDEQLFLNKSEKKQINKILKDFKNGNKVLNHSIFIGQDLSNSKKIFIKICKVLSLNSKIIDCASLKPNDMNSLIKNGINEDDAFYFKNLSLIKNPDILKELRNFMKNKNIEGKLVILNWEKPLLPAKLETLFNQKVLLEKPDLITRIEIILTFLHNSKNNISENAIGFLASATENKSSKIINYILKRAYDISITKKREMIIDKDVESAFLKVFLGPKTCEERSKDSDELVAIHEASHAVVAWFWNYRYVTFISIINRIETGGVTFICPYHNGCRPYLYDIQFFLSQAMVLLGGRCGEEVLLGKKCLGASEDLKIFTELLVELDNKVGMFGKIITNYDLVNSKKSYEKIDKISKTLYDAVKLILEHYKDEIQKIAESLKEEKNITRIKFDEIMGGKERSNDLLEKINKLIQDSKNELPILKINESNDINIHELITKIRSEVENKSESDLF